MKGRENEILVILKRAFASSQVSLSFSSYREAYNTRQRFYRFRDRLKKENSGQVKDNPPTLPPEVDLSEFSFLIDGKTLIIQYGVPDSDSLLGRITNERSNSAPTTPSPYNVDWSTNLHSDRK